MISNKMDDMTFLPPPQAFPGLRGDWGTREHAREGVIASDWGRGR